MKKIKMKPKMTKKNMIIGGIIIVAVVFFGMRFFGSSGEIKTEVTLETVKNRDIEEIISLKSTVEGETNYNVSSILSYEVTEILVREGDKVTKGQVLAKLDQSTINDEIASATKRLELSKINLSETIKNSQRQYEEAVRNRDEAARKLEVNKALYEAEAISQEELHQFELSLEREEAQVNSYTVSEGKVVATAAQKKSIEVEEQSLSILKNKLGDTYVKSTASGTVTRVNIKVGSPATDTVDRKAMFVIEDLENLIMTVKASEYDINKIEVGMPVRISADILGKDTVEGKVVKILPTGEKKDATSSEMVIPVEIKVSNTDSRLMTGVTAKADIITKSVKNVPSVMVDSIVKTAGEDKTQVYTVENGVLTAVDVLLGAQDDFYVEIVSDKFKEGDQIVNSPSYQLTLGIEVTTVMMQTEAVRGDN